MKSFFVVLFLYCFSQIAFGQKHSQSTNRAQKAFERASFYISRQSYDEAIEHLNQAVYFDSTLIAAYQQLGDIYRKLTIYSLAKTSYEKVLKINPNFLPLTYFGLAESELNTGDYAKALQHFKQYITYPLTDASKKLCAKYIADCEFSVEAIKKQVSFLPINLGEAINTVDDEYLPSVTADGETMIFTRRTKKGENFHISTKKEGKWTPALYLSENINTDFNEGAQSISQDGIYLFFTGCNRPDGIGRCDIYISKREKNGWSEPFNIGRPVNTPAWESQPSISADGKTIYFSSNRPGGLGGYDIWKSDLQEDGTWAVPINLGPTINTSYDEQAPFIHPDDQTLYLSSNGWPGFGKKDLFVSRKDSMGLWGRPVNLGSPINSFHEEGGLTVNRDGQMGYLCVDRDNSFGKLDIYSFELPSFARPQPVTYVKGTIIDQDTQKPLNVKVEINDLETGKSAFDDITDVNTGSFLATMRVGKTFGLTVSKEGYILYSENFTLKDKKQITPFNIKIDLQKIEIGRNSILNNIFFDVNKFDLLPESKIELQRLIIFLAENSGVEIEIQGHTDNTGNDISNQKLSENRAKAVYDYLITHGVSSKFLTYKGYGSKDPIADNITDEGKKKNRRTAFKITKK